MKSKLLFLFIVLVAISCSEPNDDQLSVKGPVNVLNFDSFERFESITSKITSAPQTELNNWENESSFKSYRSVLSDANSEWDLADTEEKRNTFIIKYKDVLSVVDSSLVPHIKVFMYQAIVNREGIYRTGDHYHKVVGDFIVTVKKEDYNKLLSVQLEDESSYSGEGKEVVRYTNTRNAEKSGKMNGRTLATCGSDLYYKEAEYYLNARKCKDGRKAYISALSFISKFTGNGSFNGTERYGDFSQSAIQIAVWGKKRGSWCGWGNYSTQLEWRSVSLTIPGYVIVGYEANRTISGTNVFNLNIPDVNSDNEGGDTELLKRDYKFGDLLFNNNVSVFGINKIYAEGKSRGVDNNWAVIFCP